MEPAPRIVLTDGSLDNLYRLLRGEGAGVSFAESALIRLFQVEQDSLEAGTTARGGEPETFTRKRPVLDTPTAISLHSTPAAPYIGFPSGMCPTVIYSGHVMTVPRPWRQNCPARVQQQEEAWRGSLTKS